MSWKIKMSSINCPHHYSWGCNLADGKCCEDNCPIKIKEVI